MNRALSKAIKKSLTGRTVTYLIQIFSLVLYARLFSPEQFGVIASLQVFVIFFQLFSEVGIGPALINEQFISYKKRNGIFTFTLLLGVVISVTFYFFSYFLNYFYTTHSLEEYALFIAMAILFQSLSIIPLVALQKQARFLSIAKADIGAEFVSAIFVISLYIHEYGIYSLAVRPLIHSACRFISLLFLSEKTDLGRPNFGRELFHIKSIARFSMYQFGFNFINYFSRNLDNILIAKYFGLSQLGIYEKSYQLMSYPLQLITFAMNPAIQPILSKHQNDLKYIEQQHSLLADKLLTLSIPISIFIYCGAYDIVMVLLGEQWGGVVDIIQILTIIIPVQMLLSTSGSFFQSISRPDLLLYSGCMSAITNITGICIGIYMGQIEYIAIALVISFTINFIQCYIVLYRYGFKIEALSFFKTISHIIFVAILFVFFQLIINYYFFPLVNMPLINLLLLGLTVLGLFFVFIKLKLFNLSIKLL